MVIIGDNVESIFRRFCRLLKKKEKHAKDKKEIRSDFVSPLTSFFLFPNFFVSFVIFMMILCN
jgi:hypothetical protein